MRFECETSASFGKCGGEEDVAKIRGHDTVARTQSTGRFYSGQNGLGAIIFLIKLN